MLQGLFRAVMTRYVLKRMIFFIPTLWGVLTLVFMLRPLIPGDPVDFMIGENALPADRELLRKEFNLDRPLPEQYLIFLKGAVKGDLGRSIHTRRPVVETILERLPATLELALGAMTVAILLAIPLGILSAVKKDSLLDNGSRLLAMLGVAMPNFCLGPLLIILFSIQLGLLPVAGREEPLSLLLPSITLGAGMCAILARMTRASMLEVINEDFMRAARARGLKEITVIMKHGLKNALVPVITLLGLQMGGLLAGAVITETIFSWPGMGTLLISAINSRDFPLLQGCVIVISVSYILINLLTDLAYAAVNPRVRPSSGWA
jgi:peptide/nickel transport system permease protein